MTNSEQRANDAQLKDSLTDALKFAIDWLKFAEAKNAALIGLNVAAIIGVERISDHLWGWYKVTVLIFFALSAIIALISVIPKVGWPIGASGQTIDAANLNLLFYGDVGLLSPEAYIAALERSANGQLRSSERWIATQIAIVSRIALSKLVMFKLAAYCALAAVLTPVIALVIYGAAEYYSKGPMKEGHVL